MPKTLLVEYGTGKKFQVEIPDDSHVTFGPFSPPTANTNRVYNEGKLVGTLRVYRGKTGTNDIIGMWTNVASFRSLNDLAYKEEVAREEGAVIWKSDKDGYQREEKVSRAKEWIEDHPLLEAASD